MKRNTIIRSEEGDPCPRCNQPTQVREHRHLTDKLLKQPFYYTRWFYCRNKHCKTTTIMQDKFKVMSKGRVLWHDAGEYSPW